MRVIIVCHGGIIKAFRALIERKTGAVDHAKASFAEAAAQAAEAETVRARRFPSSFCATFSSLEWYKQKRFPFQCAIRTARGILCKLTSTVCIFAYCTEILVRHASTWTHAWPKSVSAIMQTQMPFYIIVTVLVKVQITITHSVSNMNLSQIKMMNYGLHMRFHLPILRCRKIF